MNIDFKFPFPYENTLNREHAISFDAKVRKKISEMERFWKKYGTAIEKEFKKITGLTFRSKTVPCYLTSTASLSHPLTVQIEDAGNMHDNLVHELIHILLTQNFKKIEKGWRAIIQKYTDKPPVTQRHVAIHAIHYLITKKLFPKRLKSIIEYSKKPGYVFSWEIVNEEGAEKILEILKRK